MGSYTSHAEAEWTTMTLHLHGSHRSALSWTPEAAVARSGVLTSTPAVIMQSHIAHLQGAEHNIAVHQVLICGRCCSPMQAMLVLPEPCFSQGVPGSCKSQWL